MRFVKTASVCAAALLAAVLVRELRLTAFARHQRGQRYEDRYYLPSASFLPVMSLGYRQALASLLWCKSLVYFGQELSHRGQVRHVFDYTDAIIALDPDFRPAYRWVATAAVYRPTELSIADGLRGAEYLARALERWPRDGELHWDYASLLRFELAPLEKDPVKKRELYERAAPHLQTAARLGAGPPWLAINSADLLNKLGRTEQLIRHLEELHGTVQDESVKRELEARLEKLRSKSAIEAMRAANEQFERAWKRSYPYLSPDLFFLIGERAEGTLHESLLTTALREIESVDDEVLELPAREEEQL